MLFLILSILIGLFASPAVTAAEFTVPEIYGHSPSGRPGNDPYCTIGFDVTDVQTNTTTSCLTKYGPCAWSGPMPPSIALPNKTRPATCNDTTFTFYFPRFYSYTNLSIHVEHRFAVPGANRTHRGTSPLFNRDTYPNGYYYFCGGSGVCNGGYDNTTNPIIVNFS